jgi:hypothetical protein
MDATQNRTAFPPPPKGGGFHAEDTVTWRLRSPGADAPERSTPGDADAAAAAFADIAAAATADAAAAAATDGELDDSEDYDAEEDEKLRGPWESPII